MRVDANAETEYSWLKDTKFLAPDAAWDAKYKLLERGRKLQLLYAADEDTAVYSCLAKNRAGQVQQKFELLVKSTHFFAPITRFLLV